MMQVCELPEGCKNAFARRGAPSLKKRRRQRVRAPQRRRLLKKGEGGKDTSPATCSGEGRQKNHAKDFRGLLNFSLKKKAQGCARMKIFAAERWRAEKYSEISQRKRKSW